MLTLALISVQGMVREAAPGAVSVAAQSAMESQDPSEGKVLALHHEFHLAIRIKYGLNVYIKEKLWVRQMATAYRKQEIEA